MATTGIVVKSEDRYSANLKKMAEAAEPLRPGPGGDALHGTASQTVSTTLDAGTLDDQSSHSSPDSTTCRAVCSNAASRPSMYDFSASGK